MRRHFEEETVCSPRAWGAACVFDPRERDDRAESDYHDKTAPLTRQLQSESAESRFGILFYRVRSDQTVLTHPRFQHVIASSFN